MYDTLVGDGVQILWKSKLRGALRECTGWTGDRKGRGKAFRF